MSINNPVHPADFDYRKPEKVKMYAITMQYKKEMEESWKAIETKALALSAITDKKELASAIAELEELRNNAYPKMEKYYSALTDILPPPPFPSAPE